MFNVTVSILRCFTIYMDGDVFPVPGFVFVRAGQGRRLSLTSVSTGRAGGCLPVALWCFLGQWVGAGSKPKCAPHCRAAPAGLIGRPDEHLDPFQIKEVKLQ